MKLQKKKIPLLLLALIVLSACRYFPAQVTSPDLDEGQIYAAVVRQIYHVDHSFGEAPGWPKVYIIATTDDGIMGGDSSEPGHELSPQTRQAIVAGLQDEPFEAIWIASMDDAPLDPNSGQVADGEGIVINLGNIERQSDDTVQVSFWMVCGGLCGIGKTYVLSEVDGRWQVTGSVGPEIMS